MKPIVLCLLSLFGHALLANGQFAVIKDPDGYTNVRAGDSLKAKIVGRLHDGEVVVTTFPSNGWMKVYYDPEKPYDIPASAWNDLYEPTLETTNIYFDSRTACLYIEMPANGGNSASGAYAIAWVFKNGK